MPTDPPGDLPLTPLSGQARPLAGWLTTFHLAIVVLDPYTNESAWLLETAGRVLENFRGADCRIAFLVTAPPEDAREFLGPWAERVLTFTDERREVVKGLGLGELPAFVHVRQDGTLGGVAEGWDPAEWRQVADDLARVMSWSRPVIPAPGDPSPFAGSPAPGA